MHCFVRVCSTFTFPRGHYVFHIKNNQQKTTFEDVLYNDVRPFKEGKLNCTNRKFKMSKVWKMVSRVSCHLLGVAAETKFLISIKCSSFDIWSDIRSSVTSVSFSQLKGPDACNASMVQR